MNCMVKLNQDGGFMEKPSNIWLTIAGIIVSFAVALASLQGGREANAQSIIELKVNFTTIDKKLDDLNQKINDSIVTQAEIKTDIVYIKNTIKEIKNGQ